MRWRRQKKQLAFVLLAIFTFILFSRIRKDDQRFRTHASNSPQFVNTPQTAKGFLNVAIWEEICGHDMESLKQFPLFPHRPSRRLRTSSLRLHFTPEFENFGLRIFGFLSPDDSGNYSFYVASSGTSELWISSDSQPENSKLIVDRTSRLSWKSNNRNTISLLAGELYYLEVLHKNGHHDEEKSHRVHVKWSLSSMRGHEPREIPSNVFIAYDGTFDRDTGVVLPIHEKHRDPSYVNEEVQRRVEMYHLPFISESDSQDLFPPCGYNPSYLVKGPLRRYQSTWELHYTSIYPFDYSDILENKPEGEGDFVYFGNDQLDEKTAKAIVSQVWTQIQRKHPG